MNPETNKLEIHPYLPWVTMIFLEEMHIQRLPLEGLSYGQFFQEGKKHILRLCGGYLHERRFVDSTGVSGISKQPPP